MRKQCYVQTLFDLTTAATVSSSSFDMSESNEAAIQLHSVGTVTGAFSIYERVHNPNMTTQMGYVQNTDISFTALTGATFNQVVHIQNMLSNDWYVKYTHTSGAGTLRGAVLVGGEA